MSKKVAAAHADWLQLVHEAGPFLTLPVLRDTFPDGLDRTPADLRSAFRERVEEDDPRTFVEWVLTDLLEYGDFVRSGQAIPDTLVATVPEHRVTLRPDLAIVGPPAEGRPEGRPRMVVHIHDIPDFTAALADQNWSASPIDRLTTHLRTAGVELGLLTDGDRFTFVWAPRTGAVGRATWHASIMAEGAELTLLDAFTSVLGAKRLFGVAPDDTLEALLARSQDAQADLKLTKQLGLQVRQAVELLVSAISRANRESNGELLRGIDPHDVYVAATTTMMRLVFLLSAEERRLLPLGLELYDRSYAASTLLATLREDADREGNRQLLEHRFTAWPRLLALFRAVHGGLTHDELTVVPYGGRLFDPDRFPFLEGRAPGTSWHDTDANPIPVDDHTMLEILEALQELEMREAGVREKRRLSFQNLDVEQIGHVYEGLLDHGAKRGDEVVCGLDGKPDSKPEITLSTLEEEAAKGREGFIEYIKERTKRTQNQIAKALDTQADEDLARALLAACEGDQALADRVTPFVRLLRVDLRGLPLVFLPGAVYVTDVSLRRDTGTQYTTKELADEIAHYTLEPLVYDPGPAEGAEPEDWKLKSSEDILALRVCDPAVGSGAILVAAGRYLRDRLVEARIAEGTIGPKDGEVPEDDRIQAFRDVAERCLYGVDRDPMAVEMAKLSLWLVTMARERPFSFLDHALQSGDSLLGITDLRQVENLHMDHERGAELHANLFDYTASLQPLVKEAVALRRRIEATPVVTVTDAEEKARLLQEAEEKVEAVHIVADLIVGAALSTATKGKSGVETRLLAAAPGVAAALNEDSSNEQGHAHLSRLAAKADAWLNEGRPTGGPPRICLHWPIAFPEVFIDRAAAGFDAIVGNPPFLHGSKLSGTSGSDYREFLVTRVASGRRGAADLVAYFFLRASQLANRFGLMATNSIAQGDTREVGLDQLTESSWTVYRANKSRPWPGEATLQVAQVWMAREFRGLPSLDGDEVSAISSALEPESRVKGRPKRLASNRGGCLNGSKIDAVGFTLTVDEAEELRNDPANREVVLPFLNGKDLNASPRQEASRWVIFFRDWSLEHAGRFPECLQIVKDRVKPTRDRNRDKGRRERWWQFGRPTIDLYRNIGPMKQVLVIAATSSLVQPAFVDTAQVLSHSLNVFLHDDDFHFGLLSSGFHWWWAVTHASTLETRIRYTPTDCFETFPQCDFSEEVAAAGKALDEHRRDVMLTRQEGLTKTYNRVHDPDEYGDDIAHLRELHATLDHAVARAYGWDDLPLDHDFHPTTQGTRYTFSPTTRAEILDRLLELNFARHRHEMEEGARAPGQTRGGHGGALQQSLLNP